MQLNFFFFDNQFALLFREIIDILIVEKDNEFRGYSPQPALIHCIVKFMGGTEQKNPFWHPYSGTNFVIPIAVRRLKDASTGGGV
ncbi:MAG TPA: hypothetical protein DEB39_12550 [Planctomycetaceae bacterium]|nr:hypothetical protein [Planctomycetaceae bacterium]